MINWRVRLKNRVFWLTIVPAIILLIQAVAALFGINIDLSDQEQKIVDVINSVFVILAMTGIVTDPTTAGIGDSQLAQTYAYPKKDIDIKSL